MKLENILVSITVVFAAVSCNTEQSTLQSQSTNENADQIMMSFLKEDECFDQKLEKWFIEFNQLQDKGHTMNEANNKAITAVAFEFKNCNRTASHITIQEEEVSTEE